MIETVESRYYGGRLKAVKKVMKLILCLSMTFLLYSCGQTEAI